LLLQFCPSRLFVCLFVSLHVSGFVETLFWVCLKASFSSFFFPEDVLSLFSQVLKLVDEDWLLDLLEFVNASSCLCTAPPPPLSSSSPPQQQQLQQSQTILGTTKIPHNSFCIQTQKKKILQILVRFRSCSNSQFASPILS
jgi:hypothetical protein